MASTALPSSSPSTSTPKPELSSNRLYVGNLAPTVDEYALIQVFQRIGKVTKLDFIFHKTGALKGKPRGYAFVEMSSVGDAQKAMSKLHDRALRGRKLVVTSASSAPPDTGSLPSGTRGRRSEPAKTTTLSLLKGKQKQSNASSQIAAMEAKLAAMKRRKPADEDFVPGQSFALNAASPSSSREGSANPAEEADTVLDREVDEEKALGDEEGKKAAEDLERELMDMMGTEAPPQETALAQDTGSPERTQRLQTIPSRTGGDEDEAAGKSAGDSRGLPGLPPKPSSGQATTGAADAPSLRGDAKGKGSVKDDETRAKTAETVQRGFAALPRKPGFL